MQNISHLTTTCPRQTPLRTTRKGFMHQAHEVTSSPSYLSESSLSQAVQIL